MPDYTHMFCLHRAAGRRLRIVLLGPLLALALSGCGTWSAFHPPGRDMSKYDACLNTLDFGSGSTHLLPTEAEAKLASGIASGTAMTADQSASGIWPSTPQPPATAMDLRLYEHTAFQQFLDCYLGGVDPIDYEARLLRAHIALSMIAQYSASVVNNSAASKKKQYASSAIQMITSAERAVRSASWIEYQAASSGKTVSTLAPSAPEEPISPMRFLANVDRSEQIISLAAFADSIEARNQYGLLLAAVGEAAGKLSPTAAGVDIAGQALSTLERVIKYNNTAAAEFASAEAILAQMTESVPLQGDAVKVVQQLMKDHFSTRPIDPAWSAWDKVLSDACNKLSAAQDSSPSVTCLPTKDQLTEQSPWKSAAIAH